MISHETISGAPAPGVYSQAVALGDFFIVLTLTGEGVNLELGRNTLTKIEEIITQTPEVTAGELVEMQKEEFTDGIDLSLLVGKLLGQKLTLAGVGNVSAKLIRGGKTIRLFSGLPVAGDLLHGDQLILGTSQYFSDPSPENPNVAALVIKVDLEDTQTTDYGPSTTAQKPAVVRSQWSVSRPLFLRRPFDPNAPPPPTRKILYLALITVVFLLSLIVWQLRSRVLETRQKAAEVLVRQVQDSQDQAAKLTGLNDAMARNLLIQARNDLKSSADQTFGSDWPASLKTLLSNLDRQIAAVSHVTTVSTLDTFYDFSLLRSGAKASVLWAHGDEVVALDADSGAVYSLNLQTKGASVVTGGDNLKSGKYVDFTGHEAFVWTPGGIISVDRSVSPATTKTLIKSSDKWGKILDLKTFAGNIYLLDQPNNMIWKYQNTDLGFADISPYLTAHSVDFSNVKQIAIDGSIYVLTTTGNIAKFSAGSPENFKITGLDPALKDITSFFVTDQTGGIYVLDQNGRRVVVLDKKGNYQAQYLLPSAGGALVADEALKKIFLFSGAKVSSFGLQ